MTKIENRTQALREKWGRFTIVVLSLLTLIGSTTTVLAEVEKINCSESRLVMEFSGLKCEAQKNVLGYDYTGQFSYYGVFGEQGYTFRNFELAVAGIKSYVDPTVKSRVDPTAWKGLKDHFESRFSWVADAKNWSKEKKAGALRYVTFEIDYGKCIGFITYKQPQHEGYKYALNGVYCHKRRKDLSLDDLQKYLRTVSFK